MRGKTETLPSARLQRSRCQEARCGGPEQPQGQESVRHMTNGVSPIAGVTHCWCQPPSLTRNEVRGKIKSSPSILCCLNIITMNLSRGSSLLAGQPQPWPQSPKKQDEVVAFCGLEKSEKINSVLSSPYLKSWSSQDVGYHLAWGYPASRWGHRFLGCLVQGSLRLPSLPVTSANIQPMTAPALCRAPCSSEAHPASCWNLCSLRQHFFHFFSVKLLPRRL